MGTVNFPVSGKLWGVHLVPTPTEVATGVSAWTNLFIDWDWNGWIKPQIDNAVGNGIGCNCIGLIGCMDGVHAGTITQATVNARWVQLASYCFWQKVMIYPKPIAFNQMTGVTNSEAATYILSILNAIASGGYTNVIGCDILMEADGWNDNGTGTLTSAEATRINSIISTVKASTSLPCGVSVSLNWTNAALRTWVALLTPDYLDFHPYAQNGWASPLLVSDANYWLSTYPSNDIIFGEGGSVQSDSVDTQNTFLYGIANFMRSGDKRLRGWISWAAQDQDTVTTNEWGLVSNAGVMRQNKANVLRYLTGGGVSPAN